MDILCPWDSAQFFLISENTPPYLLYSHGIAILTGLIFGLLVFYKNRSLVTSLFFFVALSFSLWALLDLVQWATNRPDVLLFNWSINIILETLIYLASLYLAIVFIFKKDISPGKKLLLFLPAVPILALLPTTTLLPGVDASVCNAVESNFVIIYMYTLQALVIFAILATGSIGLAHKDRKTKVEGWVFAAGIIIFLLAFSSGNIIGSLTDDWQLAQYGLFGMPIFIGFLMYTVVKFQSMKTKILGAQVLIISLGILVFSILFARTLDRMRIIAGITFILVCAVGYALVKSVSREVKQRERLQELSKELEDSNEKLKELDKLKTEFLSLASHQLRSPLTAIKGYASMLVEGTFGKLETKQEEGVKRIYASAQGLVNVVEDLLNVSKIEQGGMKYQMMDTDLKKVVTDLYEEMKIPAFNKKLDFTLSIPEYDSFVAVADPTKIKQVFLNLVDNSIKYTEQGFVRIALEKEQGIITCSISDSGVGISPETKAKLFEKFSRGEGGKLNTGGSGLGLYLAQEIMKAHGGRIAIESDGLGKGSTFKIYIPAKA